RGLLRRSLFPGRRSEQEAKTPPAPSPEAAPPPLSEPEPEPEPEPVSEEGIRRRIEAEPAFRGPLLRLLEFCVTPRAEKDIYGWMRPFPEIRAGSHPPETLLLWMVEAGAIERLPGEESWRTTPVGKDTLVSYAAGSGDKTLET
ncbi:MAG: hypothetical protein JXP48_11775, partial [Acidobacteria bacterium]|nr:hypothetical protein [Acidobacteriota bacterium]